MTRSALGLAFVVAGLLAAGPGCSARSIVLGGDPLADGAYGGVASGGSPPNDTGGVPSGGVYTGGVSSGGTPSGDVASGGEFPVGGTGVASGGAFVIGGTGGATVATGGTGPEGGGFDPYPRVAWGDGQGYRTSCHEYPDTWGFTCWNVTNGATGSCNLSGSPYCNACSCAVPCDTSRDCPPSALGDEARCLSSPTTARSCFIVCDAAACPTGMTCAAYPGTGDLVCMWIEEPPPTPT